MTKMQKYQEVITKINFWLLVLLAFSIPFHRLFSTYVFLLWGLSSLFILQYKQRFSRKKDRTFLWFFLFFFVLHIIGSFYSENSHAASIDITLKLPFIIMPLFMFLSGEYVRENNRKVLLSFVAGNFVASLVCLVAATVRSISVVNGSWTFNSELMDHNYSFWQKLANGGNNFMYEPLSIFQHPGYFSIFIVSSVIFLLDMLLRKEIGKTTFRKVLYIVLIVFFSIMVYLLFARTGLIALLFVFLAYLIYYVLSTKRSFLKLSFILAIAVGGVMVLGFNGRMRNSLDELKAFFSESHQQEDTENRLVIWYNALDIVKSNLFFGVGTGDNKDQLLKMYKERGLKKAEAANRNIHNQFLETTIQLGLIGLFSLLSLLLLAFIKGIRARNPLLICFVVINVLFFMFESCLNRQAGVFYFALVLSLLLFIRPAEKKPVISAP